jgi:hypothetical protein
MEYDAVQHLARANGVTVRQFCRIAVNHLAALIDTDSPGPLVLGGELLISWEVPDELLPPFGKRDL